MLKVTSRDVIHSFWVPNLQGKRDLIPGYTTAIWLHADRRGVFRGQCAEFCGLQHAHMAFDVVAEPDAAVRRWLEAMRQPAPRPARRDRARGPRRVHGSAVCWLPHVAGTTAHGQIAPDLTHVAQPQHPRRRHAARTRPDNLAAGFAIRSASSRATRCRRTRSRPTDLHALWRLSGVADDRRPRRPADADGSRSRSSGRGPSRAVSRAGSRHVDHKSIGRRYLVTAFVFFLIGGVLAALDALAACRGRTTRCSAPTSTTRSSPRTARR